MDRILKGGKPAELLIEEVSKFGITINLGTAQPLGISIPEATLVRADELIR